MIVTAKQINQQNTQVGVLTLLSDACRYYEYSVSDDFTVESEIKLLEKLNSNNCEIEIVLDIFKAAKDRIEKLTHKAKKVDSE